MANLGRRVVPSLLVRELVATLQFYQDVLGFSVTGLYPDADQPIWAEVARDGVALMFYTNPPHGTPETPSLSGTLYFYPDDVRSLAAELKGKVAFAWGPEVMPYGVRELGIRDPNGYYLAFAEEAEAGPNDPAGPESV